MIKKYHLVDKEQCCEGQIHHWDDNLEHLDLLMVLASRLDCHDQMTKNSFDQESNNGE